MKKRLDLIGQLVDAVKGYIQFERATFEKIASMRAEMFKVRTEDLGSVDRESRAVLGNILALAERYPDLKASATVLKLMEAIKDVEDEIARQRYTYNNIVQEFNIMLDTVPSAYVARAVGLSKIEYLRFEDEIERPPKVEVWEQKP
jgi:LemA protein